MRSFRAAAGGVLLLLSVLATPVVAVAQTRTGAVFVTASAIAAIDQAPDAAQGALFTTPDSGGTAGGGALGLGIHITPRFSARLEAQVSGKVRSDTTLPSVLSTPVFELPGLPLLRLEQTLSTSRQDTPVFALLGYHLDGARLSLQLVGGLGVVHQERSTTLRTRVVSGSLPPGFGLDDVGSGVSTSDYQSVAVVGADAALGLGAHAALVPQVRAYVLSGGLSLRPGLGLRWTF